MSSYPCGECNKLLFPPEKVYLVYTDELSQAGSNFICENCFTLRKVCREDSQSTNPLERIHYLLPATNLTMTQAVVLIGKICKRAK